MNNLSPSQKYEQRTIKSALKKELPVEDEIFKRYDRKGRQITIGSKYEVTIDEQVKYLVPLSSMAPKSRSKSPVQLQNNCIRSPLTKSPITKSPMIEKSETPATVFKQQPSISSKILEFNEQEENTLKNLELKFQKNKKIGKKQKQCCLIF